MPQKVRLFYGETKSLIILRDMAHRLKKNKAVIPNSTFFLFVQKYVNSLAIQPKISNLFHRKKTLVHILKKIQPLLPSLRESNLFYLSTCMKKKKTSCLESCATFSVHFFVIKYVILRTNLQKVWPAFML
jgi:hypothetical protein